MRHRRLGRIVIGMAAIGMLLAIGTASVRATGQGAHPPIEVRLGDGFPLLLMPRLQKELKLSAAQIEGVLKQWQAVQKLAEPGPESANASEEDQQKIAMRQQQREEKAVTELLQASQRQRLRQILLQARGPGLLLHREVAAALGLVPSQKAEIRVVIQQGATRRAAALKAGTETTAVQDDAARRRQREALQRIRTETARQAASVLTPAQQAQWRALLGEPFDIEGAN